MKLNAHNFLSYTRYLDIKRKIRQEQEFNYSVTANKKYQFELKSGQAGWSSKTVKLGDFIVLYEFDAKNEGHGAPLEKKEYEKIFSSYQNVVSFIDSIASRMVGDYYQQLSKNEIDSLEESDSCVQTSLF